MSLRNAINEKCKDCIYDPQSGLGNWRQQVDGCPSTDCPLFPVRPRSRPKNGRPLDAGADPVGSVGATGEAPGACQFGSARDAAERVPGPGR